MNVTLNGKSWPAQGFAAAAANITGPNTYIKGFNGVTNAANPTGGSYWFVNATGTTGLPLNFTNQTALLAAAYAATVAAAAGNTTGGTTGNTSNTTNATVKFANIAGVSAFLLLILGFF